MGEDVCPSFRVANEENENREGNGASDFDQKSAASLEYIWARRRAGRRRFGRTPSQLFGLRIMGQENK